MYGRQRSRVAAFVMRSGSTSPRQCCLLGAVQSSIPQQWGTADAEINILSVWESRADIFNVSPFKARSMSEYSHACFAECKEFLVLISKIQVDSPSFFCRSALLFQVHKRFKITLFITTIFVVVVFCPNQYIYIFLTFYVFGPCFRKLAVILVFDVLSLFPLFNRPGPKHQLTNILFNCDTFWLRQFHE